VENVKGEVQPKRLRMLSFVNAVAAAVCKHGRLTNADFPLAFGVSMDTIHKILQDDLGLSKKSARWVPKLLNDAQKEEGIGESQGLIVGVYCHSRAFLEAIITMDKTIVSLHMLKAKNQSKRWFRKYSPDPVKAGVNASWCMVMVLAFFDYKGLIYTNISLKGVSVNTDYILTSLGKFVKVFETKRPQRTKSECRFFRDNAPVHMAAKV